MKKFLVFVPLSTSDTDALDIVFTDNPKEAYELANLEIDDHDVNKVAIYELKDVGHRRTVAWESQRKPVTAPKKRHHRMWSTGELRTLQHEMDKGTTYKSIARMLGRTERAVQIRASRMSRGIG